MTKIGLISFMPLQLARILGFIHLFTNVSFKYVCIQVLAIEDLMLNHLLNDGLLPSKSNRGRRKPKYLSIEIRIGQYVFML